MGELAEDQSCL